MSDGGMSEGDTAMSGLSDECQLKKLGISGGTFDPIHLGHLIVAESVRERYALDRIIFIPAGMPPHKDNKLISAAAHRSFMVKASIAGNPYFDISEIELARGGTTYTVDTLRELKSIYPAAKLFFITGADVVPDLARWKEPRILFSMCEVIAVLRPGFKKAVFLNEVRKLTEQYGAVIHTDELPLIDISSTDIRNRVKEGKSIRYLVTEPAEKFISVHGLYT